MSIPLASCPARRLLTTHVETHLDALESLLPLRAAAETGRRWTLPRVLELEARIAAHLAALQLFAADLPRVIAPFISQHPLAVSYLQTGQYPTAVPEPETSLQGQARLAECAEGATLAAVAWRAIAHGDAPVSATAAVSAFAALADLGRPPDIIQIIAHFEHENAHIAVAAGHAFTVITGGRCDSARRVTLFPHDGQQLDTFDQAFLGQEYLPDSAKALAHWKSLPEAVTQAGRINRGFIVDDATAAIHPGLDRREVAAAALRFRRRNNG